MAGPEDRWARRGLGGRSGLGRRLLWRDLLAPLAVAGAAAGAAATPAPAAMLFALRSALWTFGVLRLTLLGDQRRGAAFGRRRCTGTLAAFPGLGALRRWGMLSMRRRAVLAAMRIIRTIAAAP